MWVTISCNNFTKGLFVIHKLNVNVVVNYDLLPWWQRPIYRAIPECHWNVFTI